MHGWKMRNRNWSLFFVASMNPCDSASVSDLKQANILFLTKQNGELFEKLSAEEGALAALMRMHSTLTGDLQSAKSDLEATNRKCHSLRVASARATEAASDLSVCFPSLVVAIYALGRSKQSH